MEPPPTITSQPGRVGFGCRVGVFSGGAAVQTGVGAARRREITRRTRRRAVEKDKQFTITSSIGGKKRSGLL
jgi:hypothetical protein